MGRQAWGRLPCACCNGPRAHGQERAREKRAWKAEALEELEQEDVCEACEQEGPFDFYDWDGIEAILCGTCAEREGAERLDG